MPVTDFIENEIALRDGVPFGAILGLSPSKGARSPILWRAAFKDLGMDCDFHPFDVTPQNLGLLLEALRSDTRFVGGACAVPHKAGLVPLLDHVDDAAKAIGAVNALRRLPNGGLGGANTDGSAAVNSFERNLGAVSGRTIGFLGLGGAGLAVATSFVFRGANLRLWNRTAAAIEPWLKRIGGRAAQVSVVTLPEDTPVGASALVNCTSVGYRPDSRENDDIPIDPAAMRALPRDAGVFDIIYQPRSTALLKTAGDLGLAVLDGLEMNLLQAVEAFALAVPGADPDRVAHAMSRA